MIYLTDEGTLDTVFTCSNCNERFAYNYAESLPEDVSDEEAFESYEDFIDGTITEIEQDHECN